MQLIGGVGLDIHTRLAPNSAPPSSSEGTSFQDYLSGVGAAEGPPEKKPQRSGQPGQQSGDDRSSPKKKPGGIDSSGEDEATKSAMHHAESARTARPEGRHKTSDGDDPVKTAAKASGTRQTVSAARDDRALPGKNGELPSPETVKTVKVDKSGQGFPTVLKTGSKDKGISTVVEGASTKQDAPATSPGNAVRDEGKVHSATAAAEPTSRTVDAPREGKAADPDTHGSPEEGAVPSSSAMAAASDATKETHKSAKASTALSRDGMTVEKGYVGNTSPAGKGVGKSRLKETGNRSVPEAAVRQKPDAEKTVRRGRDVTDIEVNLSREGTSRDALETSTEPITGEEWNEELPVEERLDRMISARLDQPATEHTQRQVGTHQAAGNLSRRLNGDLGANIVRQAKIMLSEADKAEIRLIIRPPELGRVRINLQMENGHIAGRILVDNGSVREVIEQNLPALQRAFAEAGLDVGEFDVASGDPRDHAASDDDGRSSRGGNASRGRRADAFAESITVIEVNDYSHRRINLVA